jgi:hypothetical protein
MVAQGYGRMSKAGTLQSLTVNDLPQPPARVTVKSAHGGSDVEPVVVVGNAPISAATSRRWPRPTAPAPVSACPSPSTCWPTTATRTATCR